MKQGYIFPDETMQEEAPEQKSKYRKSGLKKNQEGYGNRKKSKVRAKVEHIFGTMYWMGAGHSPTESLNSSLYFKMNIVTDYILLF